jgi:rubrerythrin
MDAHRLEPSNDHPLPSVHGEAQQLLEAVEKHVRTEAASIEGYRRLAARTNDGLAVLILQMILNNEEHHHTTLTRLARMLQYERPSGPLPSGAVENMVLSEDDRHLLEKAIEDETSGARELASLAAQHPDLYEGLVGLLLELMARDSEKHERMLRFALARLEHRQTD